MTLCHKPQSTSMTLTDIHTHHATPTDRAIFNSGTTYLAGRSISIGLHPWNIGEEWKRAFASIAAFAKESNVIAIGECGLDMFKSPATPELQEEIFKAHIKLAEERQKPLIIHCVKAYDRLLALHKEVKPQQAWVLHGFRGKPQLAEQLTRAGLYISLGEKFNPDSAKTIPMEKLFIETDESRHSITDIYTIVAVAKGITVEQLAQQVAANARIFGQF